MRLSATAKHTLCGSGLRVVLDPDQCNPSDPMTSNPVLVYARAKDGFCRDFEVSEEWTVCVCENSIGGYPLNQHQRDWLKSIRPDVEEWLYAAWNNAHALVNGGGL